MKRIFLLIALSMSLVMHMFGQTVTNADGSIKFRGNVAVIANCEMFEFINGMPNVTSPEGQAAMNELATALRVLAQTKFGDIAFGIVNRDDDAAQQVQATIRENKLEDYINGYSVQAKNQGADWLFIINATLLNYDNKTGQVFLDSRLVNVENNLGYHHHYASKELNANQIVVEAAKATKDFMKDLESFLYTLFPEQYYIAEANGKNLSLGAYQLNGRILPTDKFYAFKFKKETTVLMVQNTEVQIIEPAGTATDTKIEKGKLLVKSDTKLSADPEIVLLRNLPEVTIWQPSITVTYFGLDYDSASKDGFARQRVNNAVLSAITDNPFVQLIEQETIEQLHNERELQKSEDFLNGHTVDQMKAVGAGIILKVDNYQSDGENAVFILSVIDVASNQIVRQVEISSSLNDLETAIRKNLYDRFLSYASVASADKKAITIYTPSSIPQGTILEFYATMEQKNPLTGEVGYTNTMLASGEVIASKGQQSIIKPIEKSKHINDYTDLKSFSEANNIRVKIDGSKVKVETKKENKPKRSFFDKLNDAVDAVSSSSIVTVKK